MIILEEGMADRISDERDSIVSDQYKIGGQPGCFTVNFTSPYNSIHQISGFKSEDEAQAWIAEAKLLIGMYL
jgi:hypothetical protein